MAGHKELSTTQCPGPYWDEWKGRLVQATDVESGPHPDPLPRGEGDSPLPPREGDLDSPRPLAPDPRPLAPDVVLGFRQVYDYLGAERCGVPLSPEQYDERGNSRQRFTRCEMRWDKAQNRVWVSFDL